MSKAKKHLRVLYLTALFALLPKIPILQDGARLPDFSDFFFFQLSDSIMIAVLLLSLYICRTDNSNGLSFLLGFSAVGCFVQINYAFMLLPIALTVWLLQVLEGKTSAPHRQYYVAAAVLLLLNAIIFGIYVFATKIQNTEFLSIASGKELLYQICRVGCILLTLDAIAMLCFVLGYRKKDETPAKQNKEKRPGAAKKRKQKPTGVMTLLCVILLFFFALNIAAIIQAGIEATVVKTDIIAWAFLLPYFIFKGSGLLGSTPKGLQKAKERIIASL